MDQPQKSKRMLQGGGVRIDNGIVNFNNCQIYNNRAYGVSARLSIAIPWPQWIACRNASALPLCRVVACTSKMAK